MKHVSGAPKSLIFLFACSTQILAADQPTMVVNEATPAGVRYTLVLEENLRIGPEKGDNYLWPQVGTRVEADSRGYLYVTSAGENRITVLDANGRFVQHLGRAGQGPGEFQSLSSFQILADGRAVAFEQGRASRFSWYDGELRFVKKAKLRPDKDVMYQTATLSPNGKRVFAQGLGANKTTGKMTMSWVIMDREGATEQTIVSHDNPMPASRRQMMENFGEFFGKMFQSAAKGQIGFATFDRDNNVYTATASDYQITRWDAKMKKQLVISRKYIRIAQSEAEIDALISPYWESARTKMPPQAVHMLNENTKRRALEVAGFPSVKHPISGLAMLEDGTLCVTHDISLVENELGLDLFDSNGRYLGDYRMTAAGVDSLVLVFKNGYLYRIETNDEDENQLVRYSYKRVATGKK